MIFQKWCLRDRDVLGAENRNLRIKETLNYIKCSNYPRVQEVIDKLIENDYIEIENQLYNCYNGPKKRKKIKKLKVVGFLCRNRYGGFVCVSSTSHIYKYEDELINEVNRTHYNTFTNNEEKPVTQRDFPCLEENFADLKNKFNLIDDSLDSYVDEVANRCKLDVIMNIMFQKMFREKQVTIWLFDSLKLFQKMNILYEFNLTPTPRIKLNNGIVIEINNNSTICELETELYRHENFHTVIARLKRGGKIFIQQEAEEEREMEVHEIQIYRHFFNKIKEINFYHAYAEKILPDNKCISLPEFRGLMLFLSSYAQENPNINLYQNIDHVRHEFYSLKQDIKNRVTTQRPVKTYSNYYTAVYHFFEHYDGTARSFFAIKYNLNPLSYDPSIMGRKEDCFDYFFIQIPSRLFTLNTPEEKTIPYHHWEYTDYDIIGKTFMKNGIEYISTIHKK